LNLSWQLNLDRRFGIYLGNEDGLNGLAIDELLEGNVVLHLDSGRGGSGHVSISIVPDCGDVDVGTYVPPVVFDDGGSELPDVVATLDGAGGVHFTAGRHQNHFEAFAIRVVNGESDGVSLVL